MSIIFSFEKKFVDFFFFFLILYWYKCKEVNLGCNIG